MRSVGGVLAQDELDKHGKYLLLAPSKDRSGGLGFRCAAAAPAAR